MADGDFSWPWLKGACPEFGPTRWALSPARGTECRVVPPGASTTGPRTTLGLHIGTPTSEKGPALAGMPRFA